MDIRKIELDVDKGFYFYVLSSGFVVVEDLQFLNLEIIGMLLYELVVQYFILFVLVWNVNVNVDYFYFKI